MSHDHSTSVSHSRAFAVGIGLNVAFVIIEATFGLFAGSVALLSDAGHNFSDVLALVLGWTGLRLARRKPTNRRTYGMKRATVLASLASAVFLFAALGAVIWEAIARLNSPAPLAGRTVVIVAAVGVVINSATALMFLSGRRSDLNVRGAFLHMAADAAISLGVVVSGLIIMVTGAYWVDAVTALTVAVVILISGWGLLRESLDLAMDAVPRHIDPDEVRDFLSGVANVQEVHDLHIWGTSTTETALTAHLVVPKENLADSFIRTVAAELQDRFGISHTTIQLERTSDGDACASGCEQDGEDGTWETVGKTAAER